MERLRRGEGERQGKGKLKKTGVMENGKIHRYITPAESSSFKQPKITKKVIDHLLNLLFIKRWKSIDAAHESSETASELCHCSQAQLRGTASNCLNDCCFFGLPNNLSLNQPYILETLGLYTCIKGKITGKKGLLCAHLVAHTNRAEPECHPAAHH